MNQAAPMGIKAADAADEVKVYVENGEGSLTEGDGTAQRPYQNIRTALKQIQTGQTLVLVGEVSYTKYETCEDGSPKPLFVDKDITIVGSDTSAGLKIRSMIQLGADVTFRDMWLQMVPQAGNARGTTIYAAGHTLVLDAVDTRVGTSTLQDDVRPLISGGAYQGEEGKMGSHTTIKVVNPISQTKIAAIYAGDYYRDSEQDKVDIELDSKLVDTEIHAAGADGHTLTGNVNVTLGKDSNVTDFDKTDLIGELNVNVKAGAHIDTLSFSGINNLTMAEKSRITLPKEADFNVNNVFCEKNAVLDLRQMSTNPSVANNFTGVTVSGEDQTCGSVLVGNDTTLEIKGEVYGLTKLNVNGSEYMARFVENHCYIQAKASSSGNFTIEGTQYTNFQLNKKKTEEIYSWIIGKLENEDADDFYWIGDADKKSVISQQGKEYYYPVEFMAALMTSVIDNSTKAAEYLYSCRAMGIKVLPPDINCGQGEFTAEGDCVRYGLYAIKSLGRPVIDNIIEERSIGGKYRTLTDFIERMSDRDINKRAIENLIKAGACDTLDGTRKQMTLVYASIADKAAHDRKSTMAGQMSLFDMVSDEEKKEYEIRYPDVGEFDKEVSLAFEKEVLGIYLSGHPLEEYMDKLSKNATVNAIDFVRDEETQAVKVMDNSHVVVGGMIAAKTIKFTKNNKAMAFITIEDLTGSVEVIIFPRDYERYQRYINDDAKIFVIGRATVEDEQNGKIICERIISFDETPKSLWLKFENMEEYTKHESTIMQLFRSSDGNNDVVIYISSTKQMKKLGRNFTVNADTELVGKLQAVIGTENVKIVEKNIEKS